MNEIMLKLTPKQAVSVMMAINNQMNNSRNLKMSFSATGECKDRADILEIEIQSLAEVYRAIQEAL